MSEVWITNPVNNERFTFAKGMISKITSNFEIELDQNKMSASAPMSNQGFDGNGIGKTIHITGNLFDTSSTVTNINNIRDKLVMKYWLECLNNGLQTEPSSYYSPREEFSVEGMGSTIMYDSVSGQNVNLPAKLVPTKVRVIGFSVDEDEGDLEKIPFTLTLWVCGL